MTTTRQSHEVWAELEPLIEKHERLRLLPIENVEVALRALMKRIKPLADEYGEALAKELGN
jgi:hypothetical protein